MSNKKITELTDAAALAGTEPFPVVQGGVTLKSIPAALATYFRSLVNAFTKNQSVAFVALTDGANIATDASLSNNFRVTLGGNRTLANPTNLTSGMVLNWKIKQDGTGSRTLAYGSKFKFPGGAPTLTTTADAIDLISGVYDEADDVLLCAIAQDLS
jgi:hypothetical protein